MKLHGRSVALCSTVLVWAISGAVGLAAEEAPPEKPQFMAIVEEEIIPEKMETYMQASIASAKLNAKHKLWFPYLTFVQDFRVTTVVLFDAFAQLDAYPQMMAEADQKTGGKSKQLHQQAMNCVDRVSSWVNIQRPDLSYWPKNPAFKPDYSKPFYMSLAIYHIKPGKYDEAEAVAKKLKAINEKKQSPMAYLIEESIFGPDSSYFAAVSAAKDKAAFVALQKQMEANPDPEIDKLMAENAHVIHRIEMKEGTFVPEASHLPEPPH